MTQDACGWFIFLYAPSTSEVEVVRQSQFEKVSF
jgi:hypothetical protein